MYIKRIQNEIEYNELSSDELIEYISWKDEFPEESKRAFETFCFRFERKVLQKAEIYCRKYNYSSVVALDIANCTFSRVWKYHSFKKEKAKSKNIEIAIELWLYPIIYNELMRYHESQRCSEQEKDDLCIIEDVESLVIFSTGKVLETKKEIKQMSDILTNALEGLSTSQKIIFLTYKAYEIKGYKNIPRGVSKLLRERLNLVQSSIGVYKKTATDQVKKFIKSLNGK